MSNTAYDDQFTVDASSNTMVGNVANVVLSTGTTGIYSLPITTANITLGTTGQYMTSSGWTSVNTHSSSTTMLSIVTENKGDAIIKTHKHKINLDEMAEVVETLKERLLILTPAFEKHEKYPALKEAYEHYKLIEALCKEEDNK